MLHKKKEKIILYFKEDTIDSKKLQLAVPSLTSRERTVQAVPSKKKSQEREREREEERVRTRKKKGKGEGRGERERREEERGKNGESGTKSFFE